MYVRVGVGKEWGAFIWLRCYSVHSSEQKVIGLLPGIWFTCSKTSLNPDLFWGDDKKGWHKFSLPLYTYFIKLAVLSQTVYVCFTEIQSLTCDEAEVAVKS